MRQVLSRSILTFAAGAIVGSGITALLPDIGIFNSRPDANGDTGEASTVLDRSLLRRESVGGDDDVERGSSTGLAVSLGDGVATDSVTAQASADTFVASRSGAGQASVLTAAVESNPADEGQEPASESNRGTPATAELPVTHAPLVANTPIESDYAELRAEERDESWASGAESLLFSHVANHPAGREIGVMAVICKDTQCWLVGTAYGANGRESWEIVRGDFRQQPLFTTYFAGITEESSAAAPDGHRFVTVFLRAGYQPEPLFPE